MTTPEQPFPKFFINSQSRDYLIHNAFSSFKFETDFFFLLVLLRKIEIALTKVPEV